MWIIQVQFLLSPLDVSEGLIKLFLHHAFNLWFQLLFSLKHANSFKCLIWFVFFCSTPPFFPSSSSRCGPPTTSTPGGPVVWRRCAALAWDTCSGKQCERLTHGVVRSGSAHCLFFLFHSWPRPLRTCWVHQVTGVWVYPVLERITPLARVLFFGAMTAVICILYVFGEILNSYIWDPPPHTGRDHRGSDSQLKLFSAYKT